MPSLTPSTGSTPRCRHWWWRSPSASGSQPAPLSVATLHVVRSGSSAARAPLPVAAPARCGDGGVQHRRCSCLSCRAQTSATVPSTCVGSAVQPSRLHDQSGYQDDGDGSKEYGYPRKPGDTQKGARVSEDDLIQG